MKKGKNERMILQLFFIGNDILKVVQLAALNWHIKQNPKHPIV